eukprot:scaffold68801_cov23-Prasinocladus_malaysianus.AAC.1
MTRPDTARRFFTVRAIKRALDLMALHKLNVFHWHIVDVEAFPAESRVFPELSGRGAFDARAVYTQEARHSFNDAMHSLRLPSA